MPKLNVAGQGVLLTTCVQPAARGPHAAQSKGLCCGPV